MTFIDILPAQQNYDIIKGALAAVLLVDKAQEPLDLARYAEEYAEYLVDIEANVSERLRLIIVQCMTALLRRMKIPEEKIIEFTDLVHDRRIPEMFTLSKPFNYEEIFAEGEARGVAIGEARGVAIGEAIGETKGELQMLKALFIDGSITYDIALKSLHANFSEPEAATLLSEWEKERR